MRLRGAKPALRVVPQPERLPSILVLAVSPCRGASTTGTTASARQSGGRQLAQDCVH